MWPLSDSPSKTNQEYAIPLLKLRHTNSNNLYTLFQCNCYDSYLYCYFYYIIVSHPSGMPLFSIKIVVVKSHMV